MSSTPTGTHSADTFELRDPILGDALILNRTTRGSLVLHAVTTRGVHELGCYDDVVDAWKAIDAVDQPD